MKVQRIAAVLGTFFATATVDVWAQPAPACSAREVAQRIRRAVDLRRDNMELAGYQVLRDLYQRCPGPEVLGQMGLAEHALGRWRDAYVHLTGALTHPDDPWIREHRTDIETLLTSIGAHLPRIDPRSNVEGAELRVEGEPVGTLPLEHPFVLPDGRATIEVFHPGYAPVRREITAAPESVWREEVTLTRSPPARGTEYATPTTTRPPEGTPAHDTTTTVDVEPTSLRAVPHEEPRAGRGTAQRVVGWSLVGLGAIAVGIGVWQALASSSQSADSQNATPTTPGEFGAWARFEDEVNANRTLSASDVCDRAQSSMSLNAGDVRSLCSSNDTHKLLGFALGIGGAAFVGAGLATVLTAPSSRPARAWNAAPWVTGSVQGAALEIRF